MKIGNNIKMAREIKKISQIELSEISNIPRTSLGRYERNEREITISTLEKLSSSLKVNTSIILNWTNNIVISEDMLSFINNLFPDEYYTFEEILLNLMDILDIDEDVAIAFLMGTCEYTDLYYKFGDKVGLTEKQVHNWILSQEILSILEKTGNIESHKDIEKIKHLISKEVFEYQAASDLLKNGVSEKNELILSTHFDIYTDNKKYDLSHSVKIIDIKNWPKDAVDELNKLIDFVKYKYKIFSDENGE